MEGEIGRRAKRRMLVHAVSGIAALGVVTAYRSRTHTTAEVWTGYVLYGTAMFYTCLGVNLIKESIPALRGVAGDIMMSA